MLFRSCAITHQYILGVERGADSAAGARRAGAVGSRDTLERATCQKPRRVRGAHAANKIKSVFRRDMCVAKNTSRRASVSFARPPQGQNLARSTPQLSRSSGKATASKCLHFSTPLQRPHQRGVVGVLQVAAHRDAVGQAGDLHLEGLQEPGEVHGGGLPLGVRVGGHDDLSDAALGHAVQQGSDVQIIIQRLCRGRS